MTLLVRETFSFSIFFFPSHTQIHVFLFWILFVLSLTLNYHIWFLSWGFVFSYFVCFLFLSPLLFFSKGKLFQLFVRDLILLIFIFLFFFLFLFFYYLRFTEKANFCKKRENNLERTEREKRTIFLDDRKFVERGREGEWIDKIFVFWKDEKCEQNRMSQEKKERFRNIWILLCVFVCVSFQRKKATIIVIFCVCMRVCLCVYFLVFVYVYTLRSVIHSFVRGMCVCC